ncbi:hypothetical protein ROSEINA2194_00254 [Roseburia inulinivorans DSM 16841]|uniref:Uncharacterized protein n=1 Tax=Roseburia inulinivorans DSM 16841 TaxID=622312 RepID=C0FNF9_9FIRM|nr:hypothetical protein ROSEINA2194_00254 [Roseburia inulinivorans DSM 16841]
MSFFTIVLVEIRLGSIAARTCAVIRNITILATINRLYFLAVLPFKVRNVVQVIPFFVMDNLWEFINLEFLIFGRMRIVKRPLLKRNISADKVKKPADLFLLVLNNVK